MIDAAARRTAIEDHLASARSGYQALWEMVITDWRASAAGSQAWLTYSANYLFSCEGYKWALDPLSMSSRVPGLSNPNYQDDLSALSLIALTHQHRDHLDIELLGALAEADVEWIIPAAVQEVLARERALPRKNVITPVPGEVISRGPLRLLPFDSLHFHGQHGVPETGYLVETNGARWLFPGDIRDFDQDQLPDFRALDGVVAHLWLGKACALDETPPFLQAFCDFFAGFGARQLFISHLNEFGRDETEQWRIEHYEMVRNTMTRLHPQLRVTGYLMGDRMDFNQSPK